MSVNLNATPHIGNRCPRKDCGGNIVWEQDRQYRQVTWTWNCLWCGRGGYVSLRGDGRMLMVDQMEPIEIPNLLAQSVEVQRLPLNKGGFADYMWQGVDGHMVQVERKRWEDVLSGLDEVEEQLRRELANADELGLLLEGIAIPSPYGVDMYHQSEGKPYYVRGHSFGNAGRPQPYLYNRILAWLWQLDKSGITIYQSPSLETSCTLLVQNYRQGQKQEHAALQRYIKPRIRLKDQDPQVLGLMGLVGADLGEIRAQQLIREFGTIFGVLCANQDELESLAGMGPGLVRKLFRSVGRGS